MSGNVNYQQGFIAVMLYTARVYGGAGLEPMEDGLALVSEEMFDGPERVAYAHVAEMVADGHLPLAKTLQARDPETFSTPRLQAYQQVEEQYGLISQVAENVLLEYEQRRSVQTLTAALAAARKGELEEMRTLIQEHLPEAPLRGLQSDSGFDSYVYSRDNDPRITTGLERLDDALGGGIGYSGRSVFSLWAAPSGVGKSSFVQGVMVPHWLSLGHWVYYFTGEASVHDVQTEIVRMRAQVSYEQANALKRRSIPLLEEKLHTAARELAELPGRFIAFDEGFDDHLIRREARAKKRELLRAKEEGRAPEHAQLIIVIDNLDHAVGTPEGRLREDQVYDQMARRFVLDARRHEYHVAGLAQINAEGGKRGGPALPEDLARSKIMISHAHAFVTLYRPLTTDDREATETGPDNRERPARRARHYAAPRKARGGKTGEIELGSDPATGVWFDPFHTPAVF